MGGPKKGSKGRKRIRPKTNPFGKIGETGEKTPGGH